MEPTKLLRSWPAGNCFKLCWDTSQFETWEISELTSITILIYFFFLISILTSVKKCSLIKLNVKYILKIFFTFVLSSWEEEDTSDFLPGFILMAKMALCVIPGILFKHTYFSLHVNSNLQKDKYCPWLKNHIKEKKKKNTMEERNLPSVSLKDDIVIRVWDYQTPPRNGDAPFWKSACPEEGMLAPTGPRLPCCEWDWPRLQP